MNTLLPSLLAAALLSCAACTNDETQAAPPAADPAPTVETPPPERVPAPMNEAPAHPDAPVEEPIPNVNPPSVDDHAPAQADEAVGGVTDEPSAIELAVTRGETRMETMRTRVGELRAAVEKLGEEAAQELRDGLAALGDQLGRAETKLGDLRSATEDSLMQLESDLTDAVDELETAANELAAKLP